MGTLIFIGLGLYDKKDISLKGLREVQKADMVYSEFYTSNLAGSNLQEIENELDTEIEMLTREEVEQEAIPIKEAEEKKVAFLTGGDPMAATTHVDLRLRAQEENIETKIIHSSSVFSAVPSQLGLQHYKFGRTVTLPFDQNEKEYPESPYKNILENKERGLHSLALLDINSEEEEYMSVNEGVKVLKQLEDKLGKGLLDEDSIVIGLARIGSEDQKIKAGYPNELIDEDFGDGLHCLVIPGDLHFMEIDSLVALADAPEEIKEER